MTNLRARLAEVLADIKPWSCGITIADLLTDPALARALEDAERYRWLRLRWDGEYSIDLNREPDSYWANQPAPELDAAIDAARKSP